MKTILISLAFVTILASCNNGLPKEKITAIDIIASKVDSTLALYATIDSSRAINNATKYQDNIHYIKTKLKDTVGRQMGAFIGKYYGLHKSMDYIKGQYNPIKEELKNSKRQLKDLRYDAINGLVDETQFERYILLEKENAAKAMESTKKILKMYRVSTEEYEKMSPKIDSLINEDKKKHENV